MRVAAIIIKDGKILLIHRIKSGQEYYVFPGGGVKEGESLEEALIREIKEELTLDVKVFKQIFNITNQGREEFYFLIQEYDGISQLNGEEKERMDENNQYIPVWIKVSEAISMSNLYPKEARNLLISQF
ncbi:MAG: mutT/nudix family protein [Parcubacteria group bacterium Gr01-1014_2]|nr:MAG: mutT/nudix family protein [Parcubacteria group bacterium Gr01-1014_2]